MSALHRNALLDDRPLCFRCYEPVEHAEDYCPRCSPVTPARIGWWETAGSMGFLAAVFFVAVML